SGVCATNICQVESCTDTVKNGAETDKDCGGATMCPRCGSGKGCATGSDCQNGICTAHVCQASGCADSVKNGTETDVDCGGGACVGCDPMKACSVGADCSSSVCTT